MTVSKHVAADLLNDYSRGNKRAMGELIDGTFLSRATLARIMDEGGDETYSPQAGTLERVLRFFNVEISFREVKGGITTRYQNQPKSE